MFTNTGSGREERKCEIQGRKVIEKERYSKKGKEEKDNCHGEGSEGRRTVKERERRGETLSGR
jgi:hypothetical protein